MRFTTVLLCSLALIVPAHADWEIVADEDADGRYFIATQLDPSGTTELQFICDAVSEGRISIMLYTGDSFSGKKSYPSDFEFELNADGRIVQTLIANYERYEDEVLLTSHQYDGPIVEGNLLALRKSKTSITASFDGKVLEYPSVGLASAIAAMEEGCPQLAAQP